MNVHAWERAVVAALNGIEGGKPPLGGVVERFRATVQTRQVALLADITPEDYRAVTSAMAKCSRWIRGHDVSPAARAPVPNPAELRNNIDKLDDFLSAIRRRRRHGGDD